MTHYIKINYDKTFKIKEMEGTVEFLNTIFGNKNGYPRMVRVRGLPKITWGKELTCPFFVPNFLGFRIIL